MPKFEWKVMGIEETSSLGVFASNMEVELNRLEKDGFEVERLEIKKKGILLVGKRPSRARA